MTKPKKLTKKHLTYLDDLRKSGVTNMYGASPYLMDDFPNLNRAEARKILVYWMNTFTERREEK